MRYFSAQYIFTNTGAPLKRGIITTDDEGLILNIEDTGGRLEEKQSVEFYNGVIIPGMVNCHCHLELSHLYGKTVEKEGLGNFIEQVRTLRTGDDAEIMKRAQDADFKMAQDGIVLCADICNTDNTFSIKANSRIKYINLLEVFGTDPARADKRIEEALDLTVKSENCNIPYYIVPHALYSVSLTLLRKIRSHSHNNKVTSIHFMESEAERELLENHSGPISESYIRSGLMPSVPEMAERHSTAILEEITPSGNLILVHNTSIDPETLKAVKKRKNIFFCLCPGSNLYIENRLPPVKLFTDTGSAITMGTDSLASNNTLSMIQEMRILQEHFPFVTLEDLVRWTSLNGAVALGEQSLYGSVQAGKKPGLVLLENLNIKELKLTPSTTSKRLI